MHQFKRFPLVFLAVVLFGSDPDIAAAASASGVGKPAPHCALAPLPDRAHVELAQALGNKIVYVDFWASWCVPCRQAFPFLNALDAEFRDRGLQVIGINVDERVGDAVRFLDRYRASFAIGRDTNGACPRAYGVAGMPASYLIDRRGIVREVHIGFRESDAQERRAQVQKLIAEEEARATSGTESRKEKK